MGIIAIAPGEIPSAEAPSSLGAPVADVACTSCPFVFPLLESLPFFSIDFADFNAGFGVEIASELHKAQTL